jgi:hypothetical protein
MSFSRFGPFAMPPSSPENRIQLLCARAITAKTQAELDVILPELKAAIRDHIRYLRVIALETIPQVFGNHGKAAERPIPTKPLSEALDRTGYDAF